MTQPRAHPAAPRGDLAAQLERVRLESDTLYAIIAAVGSSVSLHRVLDGIVDLLTEATRCHACFVYLREGDRLRLRAASPIYAHLVGRLEMGMDEGLAGWVARNQRPAFIRENALEDPRTTYVPELHEERFQSMVAVPVPSRSGEVLGVVVLHTEAPREFDPSAMNFLAHVASLVAGAIENARSYEEARRRVEELTVLAELSQEIVAVDGREALYPVVVAGVRRLLGAAGAELHLLDRASGRLHRAAADPSGEPGRDDGTETRVLEDAMWRRGSAPARARTDGGETLLAAPLGGRSEELGVLLARGGAGPAAFREEADELLQAVANQVALALRKAELIERLTAENVVRDLFEALATGAVDVAAARARTAGVDLSRPHVLLHALPTPAVLRERPWPEVAQRVMTRVRALDPGGAADSGQDSLRAMLPLAGPAGADELEELRAAAHEIGAAEGVHLGLSAVRRGMEGGAQSLRQAEDAARIAGALVPGGGALGYAELGTYRYLAHLRLEDVPPDRQGEAVERLFDYDEHRRTQLVDTLEQYLVDRRSSTVTARKLYIHPNTLRQRLRRIERISGLDLAEEDLLSLELAVKLARLGRATAAR